ncbi:MAG TPA: serine/threonine-protein kinase [Thermoanaerobaculia bacterium]|nr:serine/threonine-protein kinase [Thermoanaerobaculia bacterium]
MQISPGSHLGRIRIDTLLGTGGMGEVYRGWDERLERPVAVKILHGDKRLTPSLRGRILREAKVLSRLDHPNICRIYDVIERDDADYLVLELVDGHDLRVAMIQGLTHAESLRIALQIARVLVDAHAHGIVHRDLKPENLMITNAGDVKVLDFGIARLVDMDTHDVKADALDLHAIHNADTLVGTAPGTVAGTLHYMSPEQARGEPLTSASDLYSFGIVLAEMLTSESPYGEMVSSSDLVRKVASADVGIRYLGDAALTDLVRALTDVDPALRPRATEAARILEKIVTRPQRMRRAAWMSAGALLLAIVVAAGTLLTQRPRVLAPKRAGRIALLPFRNDTNVRGNEWIEIGMMELVAQSLGGVKKVEIVPPEDVLRAMRNLSLKRGTELAQPQRVRLLNALGADALIDATVTRANSMYVVRYIARSRDAADDPREVAAPVLTDAASALSTRLAAQIDPSAHSIDIRERYSSDEYANVTYAIGRQELATNGPKVATQFFAICLVRDPSFQRAKVELAMCRNLAGETAEANALAGQVIGVARRRNDLPLLVDMLVRRATWWIERSDYARAELDASEVLKTAMQIGDRVDEARALNVLGAAAWRQNRLDEAEFRFRSALDMFVQVRSPRDQARVHNNMGILAARRGNNAAAAQSYAKAVGIFDRIGDRVALSSVLGNLSLTMQRQGDLAGAESTARRQLALTRELGNKEDEVYALTNLGAIVYEAGRDDEAVNVTADAQKLAAEIGNRRLEVQTTINLAEAHVRRGELTEARALLDAARRIAAELHDPELSAHADLVEAYWLSRSNRMPEAKALLDRATPIAPSEAAKMRATIATSSSSPKR